MTEKMTPEEDAALRRLHFFERFGFELAEPVKDLKSTLRARDKRTEIRDPEDEVLPAVDPDDEEQTDEPAGGSAPLWVEDPDS